MITVKAVISSSVSHAYSTDESNADRLAGRLYLAACGLNRIKLHYPFWPRAAE